VHIVRGFLEEVAEEIRSTVNALDFIVVSSLLHEVPDPHRLLGALRSLSGPQTVLHVNVPNVRSFHRLLALEMRLIKNLFEQSETERRFQRHTRFDQQQLRALCESVGFEVLRESTYFIKPFTHRQMERLIDEGIVDANVVDGLVRMAKYAPDLGAEIAVELRLKT
jgi:hypothetical protein